MLAASFLTVIALPVFLHLGIDPAIALPLSVLLGLASRYLFRLILTPESTDVFHPATLVAAYFITYFALRTFYLTVIPFFHRVGRNPYDDFLPAALWCGCAGYVAFSFGMRSKIARSWLRRLPNNQQHWPRALPVFKLLVLMVLGLASLLYLFKIGQTVGNYTNKEFVRNPPPGIVVLLENLTDLSFVALCVFLVAPTRKSSRGKVLLLLGASLCILGMKLAISGGKIALIQPLLEAAIVYHYGRRRFRIWEMLLIGVPVIMLAFGVVNFYRFVVVGQHGIPKSLSDVISRVSTTSDLLGSEGTGDRQSAFEQMADRDAGVDALALIMKYTPHPFAYVYGVHWLEVPLTLVPRQFWKNKPINMPSAEFEATYMGMPAGFNGFSSMHLIGDLYRNFSFPGVLCGMFLFGIMLRCLYLFCSPGRHNGAGLFLYAAIFPLIIHSLESDVGYAIINVGRASALAVGVTLFIGARFWKARRPKIALRPGISSDQRGLVLDLPGEGA